MKMTNGGGLVTIPIAGQTTQHPNQWPLENAAISNLWLFCFKYIIIFYFCIIQNVFFYIITFNSTRKKYKNYNLKYPRC